MALCDLIRLAGKASLALHGDRSVLGEKAVEALQKSSLYETDAGRSKVLTATGDYAHSYAWDARGRGLAHTVTDDGWQLFGQRIAVARTALEQAFKLDPANGHAAALMLLVEKADDAGGRPAMEAWFDRAMEADPDNYSACWYKLEYLEPKWHGAADGSDMLEFGRELAGAARPGSRLPLILVEAHWRLSGYYAFAVNRSGGPGRPPRAGYFEDNDQAWEDIASVYEPLLERIPQSRYHRTRYAAIATWCGQREAADQSFKELGDQYDRRVLDNRLYQELRDPGAAVIGME